jgi:hypothetical protein
LAEKGLVYLGLFRAVTFIGLNPADFQGLLSCGLTISGYDFDYLRPIIIGLLLFADMRLGNNPIYNRMNLFEPRFSPKLACFFLALGFPAVFLSNVA